MARNDRDPDARDPDDIDRTLREVLEPAAAIVDRVIRAARINEPAPPRAWRLVAASVAAAAIVWLVVLEIPDLRAPSPPEVRPETLSVLRISNEEGVVTVTTPEGSKMIILPGGPS